MRIIAGEFKGRTINSVPGATTRPTTDRVREAWASVVSSVLSQGFANSNVLDAFAGSGALGIEALSRGAASCLFCDCAPAAIKTIKANLRDLNVSAPVLAGSIMTSLKRGELKRAAPFDLVILDPPYAFKPEQVSRIISELAMRGYLQPRALISYEHATSGSDESKVSLLTDSYSDRGFELLSCKRYGTTQIDFIIYHEEEQVCARH